MNYTPDLADSIAAEQIRYWRGKGLCIDEMFLAVGREPWEGATPDDLHHILAGWLVWNGYVA